MGLSPELSPTSGEARYASQLAELRRQIDHLSRTAGVIGDASITGDHIHPGAITTGAIAAGTITTELLAAGAVTTSILAAGAVTAETIAAGTITSTEIAAASILGDRISAATITGANIAAGTITATHVQAASITGDRLAANTVTAAQIAAATITATEIAGATITAAQIAASTITGDRIAAGTITGSLLAASTITGDRLVSGTVTADKIGVANLQAVSADMGVLSAGRINIAGAGSAKMAVGAGITYSGGTFDGILGADSSGAVTFKVDASTGNVTIKGAIQSGSSGLGNIAGQIDGTANVVPATIAGDRMIADTVTAREVAAGTITAVEIAARTITAGQVATGTLTANEIAAGTITADRMNVTSLSAITANLGSITAGTITGGTFQTATSGARMVVDPTSLRTFDSAGTKIVELTQGSMGGLQLSTASDLSTLPSQMGRALKWVDPTDATKTTGRLWSYRATLGGGVYFSGTILDVDASTDVQATSINLITRDFAQSYGTADNFAQLSMSSPPRTTADATGGQISVTASRQGVGAKTHKLLDATGASDWVRRASPDTGITASDKHVGYDDQPAEISFITVGPNDASPTPGPEVTITVPTGGSFVRLMAECSSKHSTNVTDGHFFVLAFSSNGGSTWTNGYFPLGNGNGTDTESADANTVSMCISRIQYLADTVYRPARLGFGYAINTSFNSRISFPSPTVVWMPAGTWKIRMRYGVRSGDSGTAYFKNRRLAAALI